MKHKWKELGKAIAKGTHSLPTAPGILCYSPCGIKDSIWCSYSSTFLTISSFSSRTMHDNRRLKIMEINSEPLLLYDPLQKSAAALWLSYTTPSLLKGQIDKMVSNSPQYKTHPFQWRHRRVKPIQNTALSVDTLSFLLIWNLYNP